MKSITIHGIDPMLDKKIAEKAEEIGLSQNRTVKFILQNSLAPDNKESKRESFTELFGKWTVEEAKEFEDRIRDLEKVSESDWEE